MNRPSQFANYCFAAATLAGVFTLSWSTMAFGSEIHDAARDGDLRKVRALLGAYPVLVSSKDSHDNTPLHWAAFMGHKQVAELLLASGADVNAKNDKGRTPLHWAADGGHQEIVESLLAHGADVNARDADGATPLYWAEGMRRKDVAKLLRHQGGQYAAPRRQASAASTEEPVSFPQADQVSEQIMQLHEKDPARRRGAALALRETKDPRAVEPMIAALKDEDEIVREYAALALGKMNDPRAVEPLIAATKKDADPDFVPFVVGALGRMSDPRAVEPLIAALKDADSYVRSRVAEALGQIGAPAVEPLIAALKDADSHVRSRVAEALGQTKDPRAVDPLITALEDASSDVRSSAALALGRIGTPAVEPLFAALKVADSTVQPYVGLALGKTGDPRAIDILMTRLGEHDLGKIATSHAFFIQKREPGTEYILIMALDKYGNKEMAEDYLNCGNEVLREAAVDWGITHGYRTRPLF